MNRTKDLIANNPLFINIEKSKSSLANYFESLRLYFEQTDLPIFYQIKAYQFKPLSHLGILAFYGIRKHKKVNNDMFFIVRYYNYDAKNNGIKKFVLYNGKRKFYLTEHDSKESIITKLLLFSMSYNDVIKYFENLEKRHCILKYKFSFNIFYENISKKLKELGLNEYLNSLRYFELKKWSSTKSNTYDIYIYTTNPKEYPTIRVNIYSVYPSISVLSNDFIDNYNTIYSPYVIKNINKFIDFFAYLKKYAKELTKFSFDGVPLVYRIKK